MKIRSLEASAFRLPHRRSFKWAGLHVELGGFVLVRVAGGVLGGGEKGFIRSWRATSNGLEAVAELHNDSLLCLDELGQVAPEEAGRVAYMLANGTGKTRMSKEIRMTKDAVRFFRISDFVIL